MNNFNFKLISDFSLTETIKHITDLLSYEHITFSLSQNSIVSKELPMPFVNFDKRLYSRRNWLGINPFVFLSRIEIYLSHHEDVTQLEINLDYKRAIILYLCYILLLFFVSVAIPNRLIGVLFFLFISISAYLFIFGLCIRRLVKSEIQKAVKTDAKANS